MTLGERQRMFAEMVATLIQKAVELGFRVRLGEAWRSRETCAMYAAAGIGIAESLHQERLAIDLILDRDGMWLKDTADYEPLGVWWEQQHPDARWGGRFRDGGHFSLAWEGRA